MRLPRISPWPVLAGVGAVAYPLVVWPLVVGTGFSSIPPAAFVLVGIGCIGLRLIGTWRLARSSVEIVAFVLAAVLLVALLTVSPLMAARAYPVAISLAMAAVFAASLRYPPTVVERIARLSEPDLPPEGVVYTRQVTGVWVGFLLVNAAISLWTAIWGSLDQWALWNGLLSYLAMGALFGGEYLVRRVVRA
jgi:uncharacterized membrane protein